MRMDPRTTEDLQSRNRVATPKNKRSVKPALLPVPNQTIGIGEKVQTPPNDSGPTPA